MVSTLGGRRSKGCTACGSHHRKQLTHHKDRCVLCLPGYQAHVRLFESVHCPVPRQLWVCMQVVATILFHEHWSMAVATIEDGVVSMRGRAAPELLSRSKQPGVSLDLPALAVVLPPELLMNLDCSRIDRLVRKLFVGM